VPNLYTAEERLQVEAGEGGGDLGCKGILAVFVVEVAPLLTVPERVKEAMVVLARAERRVWVRFHWIRRDRASRKDYGRYDRWDYGRYDGRYHRRCDRWYDRWCYKC
jgi:hypothetical protein